MPIKGKVKLDGFGVSRIIKDQWGIRLHSHSGKRVNKHSKTVDPILPQKWTETCLLPDSLLSTLLHVSASASSRKASGFILISSFPIRPSLTISLYMKAISFSLTKSPLLSPCVERSVHALPEGLSEHQTVLSTAGLSGLALSPAHSNSAFKKPKQATETGFHRSSYLHSDELHLTHINISI